jgi:hypothetical protein
LGRNIGFEDQFSGIKPNPGPVLTNSTRAALAKTLRVAIQRIDAALSASHSGVNVDFGQSERLGITGKSI